MSKEPKKKPQTALGIMPPAAVQEAKPITERLQEELAMPDPMWDNLVNVRDKNFVDLNFKIKLSLRTDFKRTAAAWNMSNKELMEACYRIFLDNYGRTPEEAEQKHKARKAGGEPAAQPPGEAPAREPEPSGTQG